MKLDLSKTCPQTKRALRNLLSPSAPRIDQQKLIEALPGPTPIDQKELIDLIIQIVLALLENKDGEKPEKPDGPETNFDALRKTAQTAAIETIDLSTLRVDVPKLIASIESICAMIPDPGFPSLRVAREVMRIANNKALGFTAPAWHKWNSRIRDEMDALDQAEVLISELDYKLAWSAIVEGLEEID